jgi:hypothetical protein
MKKSFHIDQKTGVLAGFERGFHDFSKGIKNALFLEKSERIVRFWNPFLPISPNYRLSCLLLLRFFFSAL